MKSSFVRLAVLLYLTSCVTLAGVGLSRIAGHVRPLDENGDGRPDVWQGFDAHGQITEVDIDSNFDGRPDILEYYQRGALVRRESDRNFNGQADLVEEFDADTHERTRSVIDIDFDGTADLLVLFHDGRPVFSKRTSANGLSLAHQATTAKRRSHLVPLTDPFEADATFRGGHVLVDNEDCVGLFTSDALPVPSIAAVGGLVPSASIAGITRYPGAQSRLLPRSPRAPPLS